MSCVRFFRLLLRFFFFCFVIGNCSQIDKVMMASPWTEAAHRARPHTQRQQQPGEDVPVKELDSCSAWSLDENRQERLIRGSLLPSVFLPPALQVHSQRRCAPSAEQSELRVTHKPQRHAEELVMMKGRTKEITTLLIKDNGPLEMGTDICCCTLYWSMY
ncbi:uncharacterized protein V6R79_014809 [Siganus canaliculatus]